MAKSRTTEETLYIYIYLSLSLSHSLSLFKSIPIAPFFPRARGSHMQSYAVICSHMQSYPPCNPISPPSSTFAKRCQEAWQMHSQNRRVFLTGTPAPQARFGPHSLWHGAVDEDPALDDQIRPKRSKSWKRCASLKPVPNWYGLILYDSADSAFAKKKLLEHQYGKDFLGRLITYGWCWVGHATLPGGRPAT